MKKLTYVLAFLLSVALVACTSSVKEQVENIEDAIIEAVEGIEDEEIIDEEIIDEEEVEEEVED